VVVVVVAVALAPPAPDEVPLKVLGDELPPPQAASSDPAMAPNRARFPTAPNGESRIEFMQRIWVDAPDLLTNPTRCVADQVGEAEHRLEAKPTQEWHVVDGRA
jgi:hypothetical protein